MGDNFKNGGAPDRSRISMDDQHDRYWTEKFGCGADELAIAVARVGSSPDAVRRGTFQTSGIRNIPTGDRSAITAATITTQARWTRNRQV